MRIAKGYSTLDLSVKSELSERTIYQVENGLSAINFKTLVFLAEAFQCSVEELLK